MIPGLHHHQGIFGYAPEPARVGHAGQAAIYDHTMASQIPVIQTVGINQSMLYIAGTYVSQHPGTLAQHPGVDLDVDDTLIMQLWQEIHIKAEVTKP
jgi:hypothetical protein